MKNTKNLSKIDKLSEKSDKMSEEIKETKEVSTNLDNVPQNVPRKLAEFQNKDLVVDELFILKTTKLYTKGQILKHLVEKYGYTEGTAQRYYEFTMQKLKESVNLDYESNLEEMVTFLTNEIQTTDDNFYKMNLIKERNKVNKLHIQKIEIEQKVTKVETIRLNVPTYNIDNIQSVNYQEVKEPKKPEETDKMSDDINEDI